MTVQVVRLTLGMVETNAYVVGDTDSGSAIVIDPVDDAPLLFKTAREAGWTVALILATHGNLDHVLASRELKQLTGAPFAIHADDVPLLRSLPQWGEMLTGQPFPAAAEPDCLLTTEPEVIQVGAIRLETLFTPGHSPGHVSFFMPEQRIVFSGDCLFAGSIGRTDLPDGDYETLMQSIAEKLLPLGDDVQVFPGHMARTTIGRERQTNPFLLAYHQA